MLHKLYGNYYLLPDLPKAVLKSPFPKGGI